MSPEVIMSVQEVSAVGAGVPHPEILLSSMEIMSAGGCHLQRCPPPILMPFGPIITYD